MMSPDKNPLVSEILVKSIDDMLLYKNTIIYMRLGINEMFILHNADTNVYSQF